MRTKTWTIVAASLTAALLGGCVRAQPYQRERLAKPIMALEPDAEEAVLEQHFFQSREGAAGGYGTAGGGCGCN